MNENSECAFCKPKKMDWSDSGFYGYKCSSCSQSKTAFIVRVNHKGNLSEDEKILVLKLCEKYYPDLKIKWLSEKRKNIPHWWDFLIQK